MIAKELTSDAELVQKEMNYILIIGACEAIFLILLLLGKRNKSLPDLFLGIMFFVYAISNGATYIELYNIRNNFPYPVFINLRWMLLFLHGPALWFYIKCLSNPGFRYKPIFLLHFVPFLFFFGFHYFNFIHLPAAEKIRLNQSGNYTKSSPTQQLYIPDMDKSQILVQKKGRMKIFHWIMKG